MSSSVRSCRVAEDFGARVCALVGLCFRVCFAPACWLCSRAANSLVRSFACFAALRLSVCVCVCASVRLCKFKCAFVGKLRTRIGTKMHAHTRTHTQDGRCPSAYESAQKHIQTHSLSRISVRESSRRRRRRSDNRRGSPSSLSLSLS